MWMLLACTDYNVSHSKHEAQAETGERLVGDGESDEVVVHLRADAEALSVPASSEVQLSIFAAAEAGDPSIWVLAVNEDVEVPVAPTALFDLTVPDVLDGCDTDDKSTITTELTESGGCDAWFSVLVTAYGGDLSYQVEVLARMDYGAGRAPGHLRASVE